MRVADRASRLAAVVLPTLIAGCYPDDILATRSDAAGPVSPDCLRTLVAAVEADSGMSGTRCAPLPAPTGPVICVGPEQASQLSAIIDDATSGTSILLADGLYRMNGTEAERSLMLRTDGVTLRSASGRRAQVILDGEYLTEEMLRIAASNVVVADITLKHALHHAIHIAAPPSSNISSITLHGLHIVDTGNRLLKIDSTPGPPDTYVDDGTLACSTLELTPEGRERIQPSTVECDMGGINASQVRGWTVRDSTFRGLYCPSAGVAQHAIHFWQGSRDTLVERNVVEDCARGVGFGLDLGLGAARRYDDDPYPGITPIGHYDGMIRNNFIVASVPQFDTGIELDQVRGAKVFHNSIFHPSTAYSSLDYRFPNTLVEVRNNIVVRITGRDQGQIDQSNNFEGGASDFVDVGAGDLHLAVTAASAIDQGVILPDAGSDIDGFPHTVGAPDIGADELNAP